MDLHDAVQHQRHCSLRRHQPVDPGQGNLYGTTYCDGTYGYGSIFELTPSGENYIYTDLHDFTNGDDGCYPNGGLVLDGQGKLYGTTFGGGSGGGGSRVRVNAVK